MSNQPENPDLTISLYIDESAVLDPDPDAAAAYTKDPFENGYWMAYQLPEANGKYVADARAAIEKFRARYNRNPRLYAMVQKDDGIDVEYAKIAVPVGQVWIR